MRSLRGGGERRRSAFLPFWALVALGWGVAVSATLSARTGRNLVLAAVLLPACLLAFPPAVLLVVAALLSWAMWLFVVVSLGSDKGNPTRRKADIVAINVLALATWVAFWAWNRPATVVSRLGSTRMCERAAAQVETMQRSGTDMRPCLLAGLKDGTGHYWLQSVGWERDTNILRILGGWKDAVAVPLVPALMEQEIMLVRPGIEYLRAIGSPEAVDALIGYGEAHDRFQEEVGSALKIMTGQSFGTDWKRWRQWQKSNR